MKIFKYILYAGAVAACIVSCEKESAKPDLYPSTAYFLAGSSNYNQAEGSEVSLSVNNATTKIKEYRLEVALTRPLDREVAVIAEIDTTLAADFALKNFPEGVKHIKLPDGMFSLVKNSVKIASGALKSADSFVLSVDTTKFDGAYHSGKYVIPVKISDKGNSVNISKNRSVFYYVFDTDALIMNLKIVGNNENPKKIDLLAKRSGATNIYSGPGYIRFGANLNNNVSKKLKATLSVNNDLIAKYNSANGTDYIPFPEGAFMFAQNEVTFDAGTNYQSNILQMDVKDVNLFTNVQKAYLMPVQISFTESDGNPFLSEEQSVVYITMTVALNNCNTGPVVGNLIDRTQWTASRPASSWDMDPANTIDGDEDSYWAGSGFGRDRFFIDMGEEKTVKGFVMQNRENFYGTGYMCVPWVVDVYVSDNGDQWKYSGTYYGKDVPVGKTISIGFVKPVTARYFKFDFIESQDGAPCVVELNAYE